jgi:hypothetical protein
MRTQPSVVLTATAGIPQKELSPRRRSEWMREPGQEGRKAGEKG